LSDRIQLLDAVPTAYVRQSRSDKWKKRPTVLRYREYRDTVASQIQELPEDFFHVVFMMPVPPSWSKKKTREHVGHPHLQKPDKDNLEKGLLDAVYRGRDDAHVWNTASTKLWSYYGAILIADQFLEFLELPVDFATLVRGSWEVYDRTRIV
jgi:Holliday junction resolvase RusA-like endonuclease